MKIVGTTKVGDGYSAEDAYIAIITHTEVRKVADKAGYRDDAIKPLQVGQDYAIAEGFNFRGDIVKAMNDMRTAYASFVKASETMTNFVRLLESNAGEVTE